jgi:hypothetical protein
MPRFIQVKCPCGRSLRALPDQAGTAIQCWDCKAEVIVPHQDQSGLAGPIGGVLREVLWSRTLAVIGGGAALITASLLIPRAGLVLALGLAAASVHSYYGYQVRAVARDASSGEAATSTATPRAALVRMGVALAVVLLLAAPVLVRNRGHALPPADTGRGDFWLAALALCGWLVGPVALVASHAHDGHGPLPPRLALRALARHPLATLAALLVLPPALAVTEGLVALAAWQQGQLPLLVVDLFPPPRFAFELDGRHLYFNYDGIAIDKNYSESIEALATVYPYGLRHGFTLVGTIPPSLAMGLLAVRTNPWMYDVAPLAYLIFRIVMTVAILSIAGLAFLVQARWLGLIAALGAHRPHPVPTSEPPPAD